METTEAEAAVIILSSSFVQRGEPAFIDKWSRAEMALTAGADLVIELPVAFSCHNAGVFAAAAVDLLEATGVVTDISFGMEEPDAPLEEIAGVLLNEPEIFKARLRSLLAEGFSYAEARASAVGSLIPEAKKILSSPNNTLAQEYVSRIIGRKYLIRPVPVKRIGAGYHDDGPHRFASASWIRKAIRSGELSTRATRALPGSVEPILEREIASGRCIMSLDIYWRILGTVLIRENREVMSNKAEMREGMENLLSSKARISMTFDDFTSACTSKRYPKSRIQRHSAHVLLNYEHQFNRKAQRLGPPYIRVLGWNCKGQDLLRDMRETSRLPVVFHPKGRYGTYQREISDLEYRASGIWEKLIPSPDPYRESRSLPVRPA